MNENPVEKMTDTRPEKTVMEKETLPPKSGHDVQKSTKNKPADEVQKSTEPSAQPQDEESFTDVIMRKAVSGESDIFNLDDNVTYKFED